MPQTGYTSSYWAVLYLVALAINLVLSNYCTKNKWLELVKGKPVKYMLQTETGKILRVLNPQYALENLLHIEITSKQVTLLFHCTFNVHDDILIHNPG